MKQHKFFSNEKKEKNKEQREKALAEFIKVPAVLGISLGIGVAALGLINK